MAAVPPFHCCESMRMATRDGPSLVLATDSVTSPEKTAFLGITVPSTRVATVSLAWIFVPAAVLPPTTLLCRSTGNSRTIAGPMAGPEGAAACWPNALTEQKKQSTKRDVGLCRNHAGVNIAGVNIAGVNMAGANMPGVNILVHLWRS